MLVESSTQDGRWSSRYLFPNVISFARWAIPHTILVKIRIVIPHKVGSYSIRTVVLSHEADWSGMNVRGR